MFLSHPWNLISQLRLSGREVKMRTCLQQAALALSIFAAAGFVVFLANWSPFGHFARVKLR